MSEDAWLEKTAMRTRPSDENLQAVSKPVMVAAMAGRPTDGDDFCYDVTR